LFPKPVFFDLLPLKIPESVLVVIYTETREVLLIERADHPGFWQSVTGSKDTQEEPLRLTCQREVFEETGIRAKLSDFEDWETQNRYEIYKHWRGRYPEGTTQNLEHVFGLRLKAACPVSLAPREHLAYQWLSFDEAAEQCFSWTNVAAIKDCARRYVS
jgi:dihydroneopterin triphosphate diphosphatase